MKQNDVKEILLRAEKGHAKAQYRLGKMYDRGQGVKENYVEATKWYRKAKTQFLKAAEQGHAKAQYRLGKMYDWGQGIVPDNIEAAKWYRKAAEQGHAEAQFRFGKMYRHQTANYYPGPCAEQD